MPWENIGDCGDGQMPWEHEWLIWQLETAISYLKHVCGKVPEGYELGIRWHEHDSVGEYPTIGICWEEGHRCAPWDYIQRCEIALEAFDGAVQWSGISPETIREKFPMERDQQDDSDGGSGETP